MWRGFFVPLNFPFFRVFFEAPWSSGEDFYHKPELCNIETISNNIRR